MLYTEFTAGNKTYKLRLTTRGTAALEEKLGCNPLMIFGEGDRVPKVGEMVAILHAALTEYNHGISFQDAFGIFDDYLADGHIMTDFIAEIVKIYQVSGIMPNTEDEPQEDEEKNA